MLIDVQVRILRKFMVKLDEMKQKEDQNSTRLDDILQLWANVN